jgi:uncharacterized DUF497 family protein
MNFEWDHNKALLNWRRHRVKFEEAKEAFFDSNAVDDYDEDHSTEEGSLDYINIDKD